MDKRYIIMCVGHTHSGKTTFAKKLVKELSNVVVIDNDEIATFANEHYPAAVTSPYNRVKRSFKEPNLKFLLSSELLKFCLRARVDIIHASGNLGRDARLFIRRNAKKYHYTLVTIYFNLPKRVLLKRLKNPKKDTSSLWRSQNWNDVLTKQEGYAELPPSKKNTLYFEIKNDTDCKVVLKKVCNILLPGKESI